MTKVVYTMTPEETAAWSANPFSVMNTRVSMPPAHITIRGPRQRKIHIGTCGHPVARPTGTGLCAACFAARPRKVITATICGHPVPRPAARCRPCFAEASRQKRAGRRAVEEARRALRALRKPAVTPRPQPLVTPQTFDEIVDMAWQERPSLTRAEVARRVALLLHGHEEGTGPVARQQKHRAAASAGGVG